MSERLGLGAADNDDPGREFNDRLVRQYAEQGLSEDEMRRRGVNPDRKVPQKPDQQPGRKFEAPRRPGDAIAESRMFSAVINTLTGKQSGFRDAEQSFHPFEHGEQLIFVRSDLTKDQEPKVRLADGKAVSIADWLNQVSETTKSVEERNVEDGQILRDVYERTQDKYSRNGHQESAIFEVNFFLDESEKAAVKRLLTQADRVLERYRINDPGYNILIGLLEQRRSRSGSFGERAGFEVDEAARPPKMEQRADGLLVIKLPQALRDLYEWGSRVEALRHTLKNIETPDSSKGPGKSVVANTSAVSFGRNIRDLRRNLVEKLSKSESVGSS